MRSASFVLMSLFACVTVPAVGATATPVDALKASASGQVQISTRDSGKTRFVSSDGDLAPSVTAKSPHAKAMAFLAAHGSILGVDKTEQLLALRGGVDRFGYTTLSYTQAVNGVPVFGARINANFAPDRSLRTVNGDFATGLTLNTTPLVPADSARRVALAHVTSLHPKGGLAAEPPQLFVYRLSLRDNADGPAVLAWQVAVGNGNDVRQLVFVSAANGKVIDSYNGIHDALERRVYDGGLSPAFLVWSEGDNTPFGSPAIDNLIDYTADAYYFFANLSEGDFLAWNGADSPMQAVNNEPSIVCPNANWNGVSINFCNGTTSDDVVVHEWSHGYTESTHGLIYRWQSGALNESYSDIFGETVDLINGAGTDAPAALRSVGACTVHGGNAPPTLAIQTPASIVGEYPVAGALFNPASASIAGSLVLVQDGVATGTDGCQAISNDIDGAIALIDRGNCPFVDKVLNAQAAGAAGVVIANNDGDDLINMSGSSAGIQIASVFVGQTNGQVLRTPPAVTASISLGGANENTYRWLMGEDAGAFGGAIRDMWAPRCFGDPGKVSDGEYFCNGDIDQGGVHSNSGVPNHAFALLVDGGTYNGVTVDGIGMDRAAHVYWRAATNYQTPTSDFGDHADALQAACADLLGLPLPGLSTAAAGGAPAAVTIDASDCAAVAAAIDAVELRREPTQCNFMTLLDQEAPALCGPGTTPQSVLTENFESGLNGWTPGRRAILNPATFSGPDWSVSSDLPDGRAGSAAYGPNLVLGNCSNDLESGIVFLESPAIALPAGIDTPRLAFEHSVMTEANYDGANIKVSVNGGAYTLLPAGAFVFNPYNGSLTASDNPMAGEAAFHGSDDGTLETAFGQSQISLAGIASPGDTVRFRFEVGMDGCNGLRGWFVDDVNVYSCEAGAIDTDGDSIADDVDNCSAVPNANQRDSNGDGYGNVCDADLNDDGAINFSDLMLMQSVFFSTDADADFNGDGFVNFADLDLMQSTFFGTPGPSGLAP